MIAQSGYQDVPRRVGSWLLCKVPNRWLTAAVGRCELGVRVVGLESTTRTDEWARHWDHWNHWELG